MQAFRRQRPEVPHGSCGAHVGARVALLRVDEIRELQRITDEKDRRIVADEIPVAFAGIELESETAHEAGTLRGRLRLGIIPTIAPYLLPLLIPDLRDQALAVCSNVKQPPVDDFGG